MKFQTGRARLNKKTIDFLVNNAKEIAVRPTHRKTNQWRDVYQISDKAKLINFISTSGKALRVDVIANEVGELISLKAYRTHWSDSYIVKF